jgi:DnaJ-class molecular chaperone
VLMDWCDKCRGRGGYHEDVDNPVYGEAIVAYVMCSDCEGTGLVRDSDDCAYERRTSRQKNVVSDESR